MMLTFVYLIGLACFVLVAGVALIRGRLLTRADLDRLEVERRARKL